MKQEILVKSQRLYELAKKADLLTTEDFSTVFPVAKLKEISDKLEGDKKIFIQNAPEKLWNEGVDPRIVETVSQVLLDYLLDTNKAFSVAYDQPVEDVVFNFKSVPSDLSVSDLGEKNEDGEWFQGMQVGDEAFWYKVEDKGLVQDVLYDLSRKLFPLSKGILQANFGDQDQYLTVNLDFAPEFAEFGFLSV